MIIEQRPRPNYPNNGKHLQLMTNLPCTIQKGGDQFEYITDKGIKRLSTKHLWYVEFDDLQNLICTKGFKTPEKAVQYAVSSYMKVLVKALKELDEYDNILISRL